MLDHRWAEAVTLLEQVRPTLGTQPDLAGQINLYLGQCYEQLVEPGQMYNAFERLAQGQPNSVTAKVGMAQAEWTMGHLDNAADKFRDLALAGRMPDRVWLDYVRLETQRQAQQETPNWEYVENLLENATKANPGSVDLPLAKAQICVLRDPKTGLDKARDVLKQAQTEGAWKDNAELWTARVYLELRARQPIEARKILDEAKKTHSGEVSVLLAEARLLAEESPKSAETAINGVADGIARLKKEDDRGRLLGGLADVQLGLGNVKAARRLWQRVAKLTSRQNDLPLHLLLFDLALKVEDEDGIRAALETIRGLEGEHGPFHRYGEALRLIWVAKKKPEEDRLKILDEARGQLDRVQSLRPTWPALFLARAQIERMTDHPDLAINNLQEAIHNGERSPGVIRDLVELLTGAERYEEADNALRYLRGPALADSDFARLVAFVAVRRHDPRRALKLLEANRAPEDGKHYRALLWDGRLLAEANQTDEAEKKFRAALRLADHEPEPYVTFVQFLARQKREKEAEAVLEQARRRLPKNRVEMVLSQCYEALGRTRSAEVGYREALNSNRQDATTVRRVAAFYWSAGRLADAEPLLRDIVEKRVKEPSTDDQNWARRHLAVLLASGTDYGRFREALALVGLKLDGNGQLLRDPEREHADSTDARRFQARVLASQAGHRPFRQRALELLVELERSKALRPDDRFILAMLYQAEGSWLKVRPILQELTRGSEASPQYLVSYAQELLEHNELDEAEGVVDRLGEMEQQRGLEPNALAAVELRARLLELQGKGDAALRKLEDLIRRPNARPEEVLLVLNSMRRQKKLAEAFARCEATWTENKCAAEVIGGASVAVLRNMQASAMPPTDAQILLIENHLKEALKAKPRSIVLQLHLADLYDQRGRWEESEAAYRVVLQNEPKNVVALNNLAWLLVQRSSDADKMREALAKIEAAVNGIGRRADLLDTRGLVYLKLGQDSAALADFRAAAADMPTPAHLFHLARAHYQARDKTTAYKVFKQAKESGLQASALHPVEQEAYQRLLEELKVR